MAGDRRLTRLVRAAATGALDFARADPRDAWWWRKVDWVLQELADAEHREMLGWQHRHSLLLATDGRLENSFRQEMRQLAVETWQQALASLYPWNKAQAVGSRAGNLVEQFHAEWGYPGEPKYEAMKAHDLELLGRMGEQKKKARKPRG